MNLNFLKPGKYFIDQQIKKPGFTITLQYIEVHSTAFNIHFNIEPNEGFQLYKNSNVVPNEWLNNEHFALTTLFSHFVNVTIRYPYDTFVKPIRNLSGKIGLDNDFFESNDNYHLVISSSKEGWDIRGVGKLPSRSFDIIYTSTKNPKDIWQFKIRKPNFHEIMPPVTYRTIVLKNFYTFEDDKKIFVESVETGLFSNEISYTIVRGDFNEIIDNISFARITTNSSSFRCLHINVSSRELLLHCVYSPTHKFFIMDDYISPEETILGFSLVDPFKAGSDSGEIKLIFLDTLGTESVMRTHKQNK
jgi:hypothetical protein